MFTALPRGCEGPRDAVCLILPFCSCNCDLFFLVETGLCPLVSTKCSQNARRERSISSHKMIREPPHASNYHMRASSHVSIHQTDAA